ncbi:hypothetical protein BCR43DRAFT_254859 [Syncephalastrum racemosum]|uniref:Uncharacterized protein n=1 Tax=Syncephalastrum racemosum TaxID=13706 RepID=A0A1X2HG23_SYNRA|nr:hypothetical protein BCR43DRAFT_254859 [Syncephalastrum racemosum]
MPPYSQPSFEVIEAKSWAAACVDSLFSDTESITFEPEQPVKLPPPPIPKKEDIRPHPPSLLKSRVSAPASTAPRPTHRTRANPLRRSLSVLESSTFITSEHTKTERSNTYRDKRTMTPSASAAHLLVDHHNRSAAQSAPELLPPSRPKRRSWTLDRLAVKQLFTTDSCSQKERDGLAIWKRYFHTFLLDTAPFLPDKVCADSGPSPRYKHTYSHTFVSIHRHSNHPS